MALGSTCTNQFPVKDMLVCHPVLGDRHIGDLNSGPQADRGQFFKDRPCWRSLVHSGVSDR